MILFKQNIQIAQGHILNYALSIAEVFTRILILIQ